jgi:hypothetical protein
MLLALEATISKISSVTASIRCSGNVVTEPLSSNGLFQLSDAMSELQINVFLFKASFHL